MAGRQDGGRVGELVSLGADHIVDPLQPFATHDIHTVQTVEARGMRS